MLSSWSLVVLRIFISACTCMSGLLNPLFCPISELANLFITFLPSEGRGRGPTTTVGVYLYVPGTL